MSAALGKVSVRRQLRHHYRTPIDVAAFIDDIIVRVVDLTPAGVGMLSPRGIDFGQQVHLGVDLLMIDGGTRPVRLRLTVATCHLDPESRRTWRIGGTIVPVGNSDRETLVEYCNITAARSRLAESGRLLARVEVDHGPSAGKFPAGSAVPGVDPGAARSRHDPPSRQPPAWIGHSGLSRRRGIGARGSGKKG